MSITFDSISTILGTTSQRVEATLQTKISEIGASPNPSSADMLSLQQQLQQWSMFTQIQSTLVKDLGDALKGVIQKAG